MKNFKGLFGLVFLLAMIVTATAAPSDISVMVEYGSECISKIPPAVSDNYEGMVMVAPLAIMSKNITAEMIQDLKIKYGSIKMITVVVEAPVYDIDNIPFADLVKFKQLGINPRLITNTDDTYENRMSVLETLKEFKDKGNDQSKIAIELYSKYNGKELEKGEIYQFLVKRPDKGLIKMLSELARAEKYEEFNDKAIQNLVVGGDMEKLDDGLVYVGVVEQLKPLMKHTRSFLSKA